MCDGTIDVEKTTFVLQSCSGTASSCDRQKLASEENIILFPSRCDIEWPMA